MAKRRGRKLRPMQLTVGENPSLWHFASLQEAISANTDLLARLIQADEKTAQRRSDQAETSQAILSTEEAQK